MRKSTIKQAHKSTYNANTYLYYSGCITARSIATKITRKQRDKISFGQNKLGPLPRNDGVRDWKFMQLNNARVSAVLSMKLGTWTAAAGCRHPQLGAYVNCCMYFHTCTHRNVYLHGHTDAFTREKITSAIIRIHYPCLNRHIQFSCIYVQTQVQR